MPSIQIKNVPDEVHATLRRRAAIAGQSLQEYLLTRLRKEAETPTVDELFERVGHRTGGEAALSYTAEIVRHDRGSR